MYAFKKIQEATSKKCQKNGTTGPRGGYNASHHGFWWKYHTHHDFFGSTPHAPDMLQTNTQTIDYLYPTTNKPPLTTHNALVVCEAVRRVCPCDDDRDAKEDDCDSDVLASDQFSWKRLRNASMVVLRSQKPSTNARMDCICRGWIIVLL